MARTKNNNNATKPPRKKAVNKSKKECMQRLRETIKNDSVRYEEAKKKERERYHARKAAGKITLINEKSDREKRRTRKMWCSASKQSYEKKKKEFELERLMVENSSPPSPASQFDLNLPNQVRINRQRRRKNTQKLKAKIKELESRLKKEMKSKEKYKKRAHRLKKSNMDTPTKNVRDLVSGEKVSPVIRKKLLYGEVLSKQLRENFKDNKIYRKVVASAAGKVVKKYRFLTELSKSLSFKMVRRATSIKKDSLDRIKRSHAITKKVREFLEKDEHSRMCPGAKDTVTRKKEKRQKRYLNESLSNLHKIFKSENSQYKLSYASFCKLRPFWIVIPKVTDRDTCMCTVHENMNLLVNKLWHTRVIKENSPKEVCKTLCCKNEHLSEDCLSRVCKKCKNNKLEVLDCDIQEEISLEQWFSKKTDILVKAEKKTSRKTVKEAIRTTKQKAFLQLEKSIFKFMMHSNNIKHQHAAIGYVKEYLSLEQVLIHIDFSENYGCKYGKEIQSAHFGGSKPQVSLHTVMLYYRCKESKEIKSKGLCTVSASLRHDSSAICAHLKPIADIAKKIVPNLKEVHFLSDSVTNQYRNKKMFYLMKTQISKMFGAMQIQWHYSEAGHGKGAPDGIGGCLKRSADSLVAQGKDISNLESFMVELKLVCKGIEIIPVHEESFILYENIPSLEAFVGTMKIHQVIWNNPDGHLQARSLSCLKCNSNRICKHYALGEIQLPSSESKKRKKLVYEDVYSDSENEENNTNKRQNICIGDWVCVIYDNTWYPGIVEAKENDTLTVNFMGKTGEKLYWPTKPDQQNMKTSEIFCTITDPPIPVSNRHFKLKNFKELEEKVTMFLI